MNAIAQDNKAEKDGFQFEADGNFYLIRDASYIVPVLRADRGWLHVEGRYNYEGDRTASAWLGCNFNGGQDLEYTITPMAGLVFGNTKALASGIEISLDWQKIGLESEWEYLFDAEAWENNYLYSWTDLYYSPVEWMWIGYTGQRLRYSPDDVFLHHGFLLGGGVENFEVNTYAINVFSNPVYYVISASFYF